MKISNSILPLAASIAILISGCGETHHHEDHAAAPDNQATYQINIHPADSTLDLCDAIDDMAILSLQQPDSARISGITKVLAAHDRYYVLDRKFAAIHIYDREGKLLHKMGKLGANKDAGEFFEVQDMIYRPQSNAIWVYSNGYSSILEFNADGQFIRRIQTDLFASSFAANDSLLYLYTNNNISLLSKQFNLIITDTAKKLKQRLFPMPQKIAESLAFAGGIFPNSQQLLLNPPLNNTIYSISGETIQPTFQFDFGDKNLPEALASTDGIYSSKIYQYSFLTSSISLASDVLAFRYYGDNRVKWGFFNTRNHHIATYRSHSHFPAFLLYSKFNEVDNQIISSLDKADSLLNMDTAQREYLASRFPSLQGSLEKITERSNPVLVLIRLKSF